MLSERAMRRHGALGLTGVVLLSSLLAGACSLDHRKLSLQSAGGTAGVSANGAQAGEADMTPVSGTGGGGSGSEGLVEGCADLDTNSIADCRETLLKNPSFSQDLANWSRVGDVELDWDANNQLSDHPSGSAKVTTRGIRGGASQCLAVAGHRLVITYASAFVADDAELARAAIETSFFASEDCSGERLGSFQTPPSAVTNAWTTIQAGATVMMTEVRSASFNLLALESAGDVEVTVYFDNVLVKALEL
jgi:hypothetical protein